MYLTSCLLVLSMSVVPLIHGHTIHMGGSCATVEPMKDFDMKRFLGKWYAIQKTSTSSRCMVYNFEVTDYRNQYTVQQISDNSVIDVVKDNTYKYRGILEAKDEKNASDMSVRFPLNVIGKSSFVIFMTDYDNYAGIYSCQTIAFTHRHSATILSRTPNMDSIYLDKLRNRLASFNVNPFDLTQINQTNCNLNDKDFTIDINETTLSKDNIKNTLKNGFNSVVDGAKHVYNSLKGKNSKSSATSNHREVEEVLDHDPNEDYEKVATLL